jgi:hypothetical protein
MGPKPSTPSSTLRKRSSGSQDSLSVSGAGEAQRDRVEVVCRFRPHKREETRAEAPWFELSQEKVGVSGTSSSFGNQARHDVRCPPSAQDTIRYPERYLTFKFDKVYGATSSQADIYSALRHVVKGVMEGINGTLQDAHHVRSGGGSRSGGRHPAGGGGPVQGALTV